jgi:HEAT repeat protein
MADPNPREIRSILSELRDTNKDKRRTAVMKLGMIGGEDAVKALIRTVENEHEDLIVRGRAALMLGKVGDQRAVSPLIRALDAPGFQTPLNAVQSLGMLGDVRAIDPLVQIAEKQTDRLRDAAITALARLGHTFEVKTKSEPEPEL